MCNVWRKFRVSLGLVFSLLVCLSILLSNGDARAEYGDVVINNYSSKADMPPPVFPHWFHRIRFRCKVCHADLGFEFKAGGNDISMVKIFEGEYCGACHNGEIAWSVENCNLCHTGNIDAKTKVHNSTLDLLVSPVKAKKDKSEKIKTETSKTGAKK